MVANILDDDIHVDFYPLHICKTKLGSGVNQGLRDVLSTWCIL